MPSTPPDPLVSSSKPLTSSRHRPSAAVTRFDQLMRPCNRRAAHWPQNAHGRPPRRGRPRPRPRQTPSPAAPACLVPRRRRARPHCRSLPHLAPPHAPGMPPPRSPSRAALTERGRDFASRQRRPAGPAAPPPAPARPLPQFSSPPAAARPRPRRLGAGAPHWQLPRPPLYHQDCGSITRPPQPHATAAPRRRGRLSGAARCAAAASTPARAAAGDFAPRRRPRVCACSLLSLPLSCLPPAKAAPRLLAAAPLHGAPFKPAETCQPAPWLPPAPASASPAPGHH
jgi:hypothetical protein